MRLVSILACACLAALVAACGGDDDGGSGAPKARAFPVGVETIEGRKVEYVVSATGSVDAFEEVLITAQVQGVVEKINFREGQAVTPETVLAEIEPKRFQYSYNAAQAAHDRAKAELKEAQEGLKRREDPKGSIFSKEEIEAWRTKVAVAEANERERAAEFSQAELDLQNATPTSPIAGIIQSRLVQTGQWVQPGTVIARLLRRDPLLLKFTVPEEAASAMAKGMEARFSVSGEKAEYTASIIHIGASADPATRMVNVTAEVSGEPASTLTPGSFALVKVPVGSSPNAPTVPETAVRASEKGMLVYVVKDGKAHERVIEIGLRTPDGRIEVRSGVEPGEVVVVRGADALRDGAAVKIAGQKDSTAGAPAGAKP
ncbi:MAG: efflux RND transporter periplasmic adaptor subunit [Planctomycetes bacterium]|nr:efflux RND transporter periplasmic adaptor subunit [Planctomycetota bacterium]